MKIKIKTKKKIYVGLTIFLGILLSFILHAWWEMSIIKTALSEEKIITGTYFFGVGWCALPVWVQYTFPLLGIVVGGYFLGQTWWRIVYIEKRHWRFKKIK